MAPSIPLVILLSVPPHPKPARGLVLCVSHKPRSARPEEGHVGLHGRNGSSGKLQGQRNTQSLIDLVHDMHRNRRYSTGEMQLLVKRHDLRALRFRWLGQEAARQPYTGGIWSLR